MAEETNMTPEILATPCKCGANLKSYSVLASDPYGVCDTCKGHVEVESIPASNPMGRYFWQKCSPSERTEVHPANLPDLYVEVRPGFYEVRV